MRLQILLCGIILSVSGCGTVGYSRSEETNYRLHNVQRTIEKIKEADPAYTIKDMDNVTAWALKNRVVAPGDLEEFKNDGWHNPFLILPNDAHSGVIVSSGPNGIYENGMGDDLSLKY